MTLILLVSTSTVYAQTKYLTRTGQVNFFSETPIENIEAKNGQASSIFVPESKIIAVNVPMRSFKFEKALMEEHFNEKYIHSDEYPTAKFKGTIVEDIDFSKDVQYDTLTLQGTLYLHDVEKSVNTLLELSYSKKEDIFKGKSSFTINPKDYNIEIPSLVEDKISDEILVTINLSYSKK